MEENKSDIYASIIAAYRQAQSVNKTVELTKASKLTVQKVLITEGLWKSERSREVLRLKNEEYTTEEIAERLHISVKGVQAYLPYSRKPYGTVTTSDSVKSKKKRDKMRSIAERQINDSERAEKTKTTTRKGLNMGNVLQFKPAEKENSKSKMKKAPSLYKLHLELVQDEDGMPIQFSPEEEVLLSKYAKFKAGFSRDIVVPGNMTLHSLHYAIQRLFGWQNSHLRQFSLMPNDFKSITDDTTSEWLALCGVYFRFPQEEDEDAFWDDDYDGQQSFKTWLKQKYKGPYCAYGISDTYFDNQIRVKEFNDRFPEIIKQKVSPTLDGLTRQIYLGGDYNSLLERIRVSELLVPYGMPMPDKEDWTSITSANIKKTRETIVQFPESFIDMYMNSVIQMQYNKKDAAVASFNRMKADMEPALIPFVHDIMYQYDFGDGWCVRITCEEAYYYNDLYDIAENQYVVAKLNDTEAIKDWDFYRVSDDGRVDDALNEILRRVEYRQIPICVDADGLSLVDDVGGVWGYIDFIGTLHGDDKEEAQSMREWAESLGWSPRINKPEKML